MLKLSIQFYSKNISTQTHKIFVQAMICECKFVWGFQHTPIETEKSYKSNTQFSRWIMHNWIVISYSPWNYIILHVVFTFISIKPFTVELRQIVFNIFQLISDHQWWICEAIVSIKLEIRIKYHILCWSHKVSNWKFLERTATNCVDDRQFSNLYQRHGIS